MRAKTLATVAALAGFAAAQSARPEPTPFPSSCSGVSAARFAFTLAENWSMTKLIGGLSQPRTIVFDSLGQMLVLQASTGISVHTFGSDGCVSSSTSLIQNRGLNHGLALSPDGKTLYASSATTVWSWDYDASSKRISNQKTIVRGMSNGGHVTRTVQVVPNAPNLIIVSVGSNSNWDYPSGNPAVGRSCVKVFDVSKAPSNGYNYPSEGQMLAYGLRNEIGLTFDPNGMVWGVENSGDVSYSLSAPPGKKEEGRRGGVETDADNTCRTSAGP